MQHTPHAQIPRASPRELSHMPLGINSTEQVFHCCEEDGELITAFLSSFFEIYCRSGKIAQRGIIDMERFFYFFLNARIKHLSWNFNPLFCFVFLPRAPLCLSALEYMCEYVCNDSAS